MRANDGRGSRGNDQRGSKGSEERENRVVRLSRGGEVRTGKGKWGRIVLSGKVRRGRRSWGREENRRSK